MRAEAAKLDACVAAIRDVRAAKLEESPIPGLSVREGEVYYEIDTGIVPFDRLNTAKQYELAMAIAVLGERKLPFMVCDRAESLDGEKWDEFCGAVKASGMQVIVARVDEAEGLTVTTE